jgi:N-acetylglutamate synthase-like GNAT family acetyltransferase
MSVRVRDAVKADFDALGAPALFRMRALTMEADDGNILGVGGTALLADGRLMCFADLKPEARRHPVALHKAASSVMARLKAEGVRNAVALADLSASPAAERWLERFGFERKDYGGKTVWEWMNNG